LVELGGKAGARFLVSNPAHFIAFSGGAGLIPFAPGTFGTLVALPIFSRGSARRTS